MYLLDKIGSLREPFGPAMLGGIAQIAAGEVHTTLYSGFGTD